MLSKNEYIFIELNNKFKKKGLLYIFNFFAILAKFIQAN